MAFKKYRAAQLFDGRHLHDDQQVLITREDGTIEGIIPLSEAGDDVTYHEGILMPGLINCHCHLELSHLKDVIPPHTGLIEFLCSVVTKRGFDPAIIQQRIIEAEKEMADNGIMAVGDIGNTADTATVKSTSGIRWQNFVEVLSFTDEKSADNFKHYSAVRDEMEQKTKANPVPHRSVLVPHAPYTISPKTFEAINAATAGQIISIHNQEHPAEDELYQTGGGEYLKLFKIFGIESSPFPVTGLSSIRSVLPYFNNGQTILLIHNTFMPESDVQFAQAYAKQHGLKLVWCLCVNANLYIENKVPPVEMLIRNGCDIVLGTDSYSSNWQLSIAKEILAIREHFPDVPMENVLHWATAAGAKALGWEELGIFSKGNKPGLVLLDPGKGISKRLA